MSTEAPPTNTPAPAPPGGDIVARAGTYYRNTRYFLTIALVAFGLWYLRDGFFAWPAANEKAIEQEKLEGKDPKPLHSDMDVFFNKVLGIILPPGALLLLGWAIYSSRGEIRLSNDVLTVPGHPSVPLLSIEAIDKQKWDRKGIALVSYRLDSGKFGKIKLDDFVYDRPPIDQIFERIEQSLQAPRSRKMAPPPPPARR